MAGLDVVRAEGEDEERVHAIEAAPARGATCAAAAHSPSSCAGRSTGPVKVSMVTRTPASGDQPTGSVVYDWSYAARITVHGDNAFLAFGRCDLGGNHSRVRIKDSAHTLDRPDVSDDISALADDMIIPNKFDQPQDIRRLPPRA
jgi:hypothetical protein